MVPIDLVTDKADRQPARHVRRLRVGFGIDFEQHRLFVEAADANADDGFPVAMVVVPKLRELLAGYEEGRLPVRQPLLGLRKFERDSAHAVQYFAHCCTNSSKISGYNSCSAASTRCWSVSGVSPWLMGTSALPRTSPASSSSVTIWTEQPPASSPASSARRCVSSPRYFGRSEGWMLRIRP